MRLLAIDPGTTHTGYAILNGWLYPVEKGKVENDEIIGIINNHQIDVVVIEMVSSYGKPVGKEVFETCVWIGRFEQTARFKGIRTERIERRDVKRHLTGKVTTKDSDVRAVMIRRFASTESGKGTKDHPDWFYGFSKDAWQAYALGVTWMDMRGETTNYAEEVRRCFVGCGDDGIDRIR